MLTYAAALEQFSNHPIVKAIVKNAEEQGLSFNKLHVSDVEEILGNGIIGNVNGAQVVIGNMDLMKQYSCNYEKIAAFYENEKHTFICIAINKVCEASLCLIDDVRRDALEAIDALKRIGIHTVMLTGDKREIAEKLGVKEVYAELFPKIN